MNEKFLTFVRLRIGVGVMMTLTANTILFFAIQAYTGSTSSDRSYDLSIKQSTVYKRNSEKLRQNSTNGKTLKKNSEGGRVSVKSDLSQMDYLPSKSLKVRSSNEFNKHDKLLNQSVVNKEKTASISRKQKAIEQINALANANAGQVYQMYDVANEPKKVDDHTKINSPNEAEVHAKANASKEEKDHVDVKNKFNGNQKVPNTFNAEYVEYFWRHPELSNQRGSVNVLQDEPNHRRKDNNEKDKNIPVEKVIQSKPNESIAESSKTVNYTDLHKESNVTGKTQKCTSQTKHHITMFPAKGQLGNQMFQLASLLGIAEFGNFTPFLPNSVFNLNKVFQLPSGFFKDTDITDFDHFMEEPQSQNESIKSSQTLDKCRDWTLDGYFQSFKYFSHVADKIWRHFKFHKAFLVKAVDFMKTTVPGTHVKVAIHIRRGDFINSHEVRLGRVAASPGYVRRAMKYFQSRYENVTFIVVSDDMQWCLKHITGDNVKYSTTPYNQKGVDLAIISICDHVIISVGSFGWWGGWLSGGTVIYYKKFPRPGSELDKKFVPENYYPRKWIGLY